MGKILRPAAARPPVSIWDIGERLEENFQRVEAILREMETQGDPRVRVAAAAELRHHIALAVCYHIRQQT